MLFSLDIFTKKGSKSLIILFNENIKLMYYNKINMKFQMHVTKHIYSCIFKCKVNAFK